MLDGLIILPVAAVVLVVVLLIAAPHFGPLFPSTETSTTSSTPTPGFVWLELTVIAWSAVVGVFDVFYQAFCTVRWGRTPGKAIMHVRPIKVDGSRPRWGAALGREAVYRGTGLIGVVGFIDPLWCLWDNDHQCLHDKAASTIVVQD